MPTPAEIKVLGDLDMAGARISNLAPPISPEDAARHSEVSNLTDQLSGKANLDEVTSLLSTKANTTDVNTALALKADATALTSGLAGKTSPSDVATLIAGKASIADVTTALANKADNAALTAALSLKADTTALTSGLAGKTSPTDVATLIAGKADTTDVTAALAAKVDTSTYNAALVLKADSTALTSGLAAKVDTSTYTSGLAGKTSPSDVVTLIGNNLPTLSWASPGAIGATTPSTGKFTGLTLTGGATATNTTSGDVVVPGGVGIGGALYVGGNLYQAGVQAATIAQVCKPNWILNGDFSINNDPKNGVSITSAAYFNDVWLASPGAGTCTPTITAFTVGSTPVLPNPPRFYLKFQQTASSATSTYIAQRIEDVRSLAGKTVTLSFWASSAANLTTRNISLTQYFGSGGSPSTSVTTVLSTGINVTSTWTQYTLTVTLPDVTSKTLGSDGISYLELDIYLPLSSTYTFNVTNVKLEVGAIATLFDNSWDAEASDIKACERYFQVIGASARFYAPTIGGGNLMWAPLPFRSPMRATPTATIQGTYNSLNLSSSAASPSSNFGGIFQIIAAAMGDCYANVWLTLAARL